MEPKANSLHSSVMIGTCLSCIIISHLCLSSTEAISFFLGRAIKYIWPGTAEGLDCFAMW